MPLYRNDRSWIKSNAAQATSLTPPRGDLASALGVSRRTILRNIKVLA
jgi:DNA-binding GntR family transcriptional regulator